MQIGLVNQTSRLIRLGCPNRTLDRLVEQIHPLLADTDAMLLQEDGASLNETEISELRALAPKFKAACHQLASYKVPSTLEYGDSLGVNIMVTDENYIFFDWAYSSVAHPFFSLAFSFPEPEAGGPSDFYAILFRPDIRRRLRDAYLEPWAIYEPISRLIEAFELAQPLAALHYALTYHRFIVPNIEVKSEWAGMVPRRLKAVLAHKATLSKFD